MSWRRGSDWTWVAGVVVIVLTVGGIAIYFNEGRRDAKAERVCTDNGGGELQGGSYSNVAHAFCNDGTVYHLHEGEVYDADPQR